MSRCESLAAAVLLASVISAGAQTPAPNDIVKRGEYLARIGDCLACHTAPGGKPYAGGLVIETPFGGIASPNITPDKATGIGNWSDEQFYRAMHEGVGHKGEYLYPAFPFTSFTKVSTPDVFAIKAFLFSLEPVSAPRPSNTLHFPFNVRQTLLAWRELFFRPDTFKPDPAWSAQVARGAYLVEGLGHCGECHTPRNVLGAMEQNQALGGALINGWLSPNISSDVRQGIGGWTDDELAAFLKTGVASTKGVAFGPMADVVHDSLQYASDDDIRAVVAYLRTTPTREQPATPSTDPTQAQGAALYLDNCAQCHQALGAGIPGTIPALARNAAVTATAPNDVIMAVLNGLPGTGDYGAMPSFAASLDDQQVADLTNYVRTAWSNQGTPDATAELVAGLREQSTVPAPGTEAAVAFGCSKIGASGAPGQLPDAASGIYDMLKGENAATLPNRISEVIGTLRAQNVDADIIVDTLIAAYCPLVAAETGLTAAQKKERIDLFGQQVTAIVYPETQPQVRDIVVTVPLPPDVEQKVNDAARSAQLSREAWLAQAIEKALPAGK